MVTSSDLNSDWDWLVDHWVCEAQNIETILRYSTTTGLSVVLCCESCFWEIGKLDSQASRVE